MGLSKREEVDTARGESPEAFDADQLPAEHLTGVLGPKSANGEAIKMQQRDTATDQPGEKTRGGARIIGARGESLSTEENGPSPPDANVQAWLAREKSGLMALAVPQEELLSSVVTGAESELAVPPVLAADPLPTFAREKSALTMAPAVAEEHLPTFAREKSDLAVAPAVAAGKRILIVAPAVAEEPLPRFARAKSDLTRAPAVAAGSPPYFEKSGLAMAPAVAEEPLPRFARAKSGLAMAPAVAEEPPSRVEEQEQPRDHEGGMRDNSNSTPGAYRVSGEGATTTVNDDSTHYTDDVVGMDISQVTSSMRDDSTSTDQRVHILAHTMASQVFEGVPDGAMDKRRRRLYKITIIAVVGILVIAGGSLGAVLSTRNRSITTLSPTNTPTRQLVEWAPVGSEILGINPGDQNGVALAMSDNGSILAVGATKYDGFEGTKNETGLVRVYIRSDNSWVQQGSDIEGESIGEESGIVIALSSDGATVAIGAWKNSQLNFEAGSVRVFVWSGTDWLQRGVDIDGEAIEEQFGSSVALSGNGLILAIGSPRDHGLIGSMAGRVQVYEWDSFDWVQRGTGIEGEDAGDVFGESVSLSEDGRILAAGALKNDPKPEKEDAGHVRVFEWNDTAWNQVGANIDGEAAGDESGNHPAVVLTPDGHTVAIGARLHDGISGVDSGHVRVLDYIDSEWTQRGGDDDIQGVFGDNAGVAVAISNDGNTVLAGAWTNRRNGRQAGAARVFSWTGLEWLQLGDDIYGETAGDLFGGNVAISGDGSIIAIGAASNDGRGEASNVGQVRIFELVLI